MSAVVSLRPHKRPETRTLPVLATDESATLYGVGRPSGGSCERVLRNPHAQRVADRGGPKVGMACDIRSVQRQHIAVA